MTEKRRKRARNLTIDMNELGLSSLETIKAVLDNEQAHAMDKKKQLKYLFLTTVVKAHISERTEKGVK